MQRLALLQRLRLRTSKRTAKSTQTDNQGDSKGESKQSQQQHSVSEAGSPVTILLDRSLLVRAGNSLPQRPTQDYEEGGGAGDDVGMDLGSGGGAVSGVCVPVLVVCHLPCC